MIDQLLVGHATDYSGGYNDVNSHAYCFLWEHQPMIYSPAKITSLREERGWSVTELAKRAGIKQPSLWAIERGRIKQPKFTTLTNIAAALGVPVQTILSETPPKNAQDALETLIAGFQTLSPQNQRAVAAMVKALKDQQGRR